MNVKKLGTPVTQDYCVHLMDYSSVDDHFSRLTGLKFCNHWDPINSKKPGNRKPDFALKAVEYCHGKKGRLNFRWYKKSFFKIY